MTSSSVLRELRTELEPELLRGVALDRCLSGWAQHWAPPEPGMFNVDHANYELSHQTEYYDEFLSHDWETSRWYKLCTMLVIYNSQAAFYCSLAVSILVGVFKAAKILPNELWLQLSVFAVFPLVLLFWQRIRSLFAKPMVVFLDKLCIAQHDEDLKLKGVFGLAGFLDHSKQLTVFWSRRYFSRLWCTYEVGTFLRAKTNRPILVIPVKLAVILCFWSAAEMVIFLGYYISADLNYGSQSTEIEVDQLFNFWLLLSLFYVPALPVLFYIGIGMMSDLKELPDQLQNFRVQDAKCFCCSNQHRHPDTGEVLLCDRELMFQTLKKWFGQKGAAADDESHLEVFNQLVHRDLAPKVLKSVGSDVLPFNYCMYMAVVTGLPGLCTLIPILAEGPGRNFDVLQHVAWTLREIMNWSFPGLIVLYAMRLSSRGWLIALRLSPKCPRYHRWIWSLLLPWVLSTVLTGIWFSFQLTVSQTEADSLMPAIPFAAWTLILYCFWKYGTPNTSRSTSSAIGVTAVSEPTFKEDVLSKAVSGDGNILADSDSVSTFSA